MSDQVNLARHVLLSLPLRLPTGTGGVELLWEIRDCWVGVYWDVKWRWQPGGQRMDAQTTKAVGRPWLFVYVCLVPLLPVRLRIPLRASPPAGAT